MDQASLWRAVLGEAELSVSRGIYSTWFKKTQLLQLSDELAVVGVHNIFAIGQMQQPRHADLIKELLKKNGYQPAALEFKVLPAAKNKPESAEDLLVSQPVEAPSRRQAESGGAQASSGLAAARPANPTNSLAHSYRQGLNVRYTFDNFVVGASNELAFAACQGIAQQPGSKYNPLFLYGGVGIGKTHLIQAAGNAFLANHPGAKVLYISTEQFVQEFVDALRFRKTAEFARHYRSADMLIVDDIQFIAGKDKTEEEFFHTFNTLHQANKQIIISSDRRPQEIPTIQDRLRSRFAWGMSIDMQIPDFETRCAIVQSKAQESGVDLDPEVVDYLANNIQTNIRELEGALNQLLAFCEMRGLTPDLEMATGVLAASKTRPKHLSAKQIVERTARHFQVPLEDILGPRRDKDIVLPRQIAMYMMRSELHLSFPKIAHELGRKDHTTAIHSVEKIDQNVRLDPALRTAVAEIRERLYA